MRKVSHFVLFLFPLFVAAQQAEYQISSYLEEGTKAPNTHYIGEAWLNGIIHDNEAINYNITKATFKANSTLDWQKHTEPQVLIIVDGEGYYQERGKAPILLREGDVITCTKDTEHWHSSSKKKEVTYLAIYSGETLWTQILSQKDYDAVAQKLKKK